MSVSPTPPEGKYTCYPDKKVNELGVGPTLRKETTLGPLAYRVSSLANFQNAFSIANIFSKIRAFITNFLGMNALAKPTLVKRRFSELTAMTGEPLVSGVRSAMNALAAGRRGLSLTEAQQLRADSALALYNSGFDRLVVEHYANWQTEGSPREGEVWSLAYERLLSNAYKEEDIDPEIGMLLLQHVGTHYPPDRVATEKLSLGKAVLQSLISQYGIASPELRGEVGDVRGLSALKNLWVTVIGNAPHGSGKQALVEHFLRIYPEESNNPSVILALMPSEGERASWEAVYDSMERGASDQKGRIDPDKAFILLQNVDIRWPETERASHKEHLERALLRTYIQDMLAQEEISGDARVVLRGALSNVGEYTADFQRMWQDINEKISDTNPLKAGFLRAYSLLYPGESAT